MQQQRGEAEGDAAPGQNWRQFQGTELGGLMARLYGNENKPVVNYPKPKQKKFTPPPTFIPGGAKHDSTDPRKSTFTKGVPIDVPVPTGGRKPRKWAAVDLIPHRKAGNTIQTELDDIRMRQAHYRPAHSQAYSSAEEKDKYAQICQYKGGKGLPEELTQAKGDAPFEVQRKNKENELFAQRKLAKLQRQGKAPPVAAPSAPLSATEQLMEQITEEIRERTEYLAEIADAGGSNAKIVSQMRGEISERVSRLRQLEKEL